MHLLAKIYELKFADKLSHNEVWSRVTEDCEALGVSKSELTSILDQFLHPNHGLGEIDRNTIRFSIVVPVYNALAYLDECVTSVLTQDFRNLELILVDDCGEDGSWRVMLQSLIRDPRVKYIRNRENMGLLQARHQGVSVASGAYLAHLDADDFFLPGLFNAVDVKLHSVDAEVVHFGMQRLTSAGFKPHPASHCKHEILEEEMIFQAFLKREINFSMCNKVYRRDLWERCEHLFPRGNLRVEDLSRNLHLLRHAKKYAVIDDKFYVYRITEGSDSRSASLTDEAVRALSVVRHIAKVKTELAKENKLVRYLPILGAFEQKQYTDYVKRFVRWFKAPQNLSLEEQKYVESVMRKLVRLNGYAPLARLVPVRHPKMRRLLNNLRPIDWQEQVPLTICVPAYNIENHIGRAVHSILDQADCDFEVIVVDDCSSDATPEVLAEIAKTDSRLRIIRHEVNKGLLQARLTAVRAARGRIIGHVDGDDEVQPGMFAAMLERIEASGADMVQCGYYTIDGEHKKKTAPKTEIILASRSEIWSEYLGEGKISNNMWSKFVRREIWVATLPYMPSITYKAEDLVQNTYICAFCDKVVLMPEAFINYFIRPNSGDRIMDVSNISRRVLAAVYILQNWKYVLSTFNDRSVFQKDMEFRYETYLYRCISSLKEMGRLDKLSSARAMAGAVELADWNSLIRLTGLLHPGRQRQNSAPQHKAVAISSASSTNSPDAAKNSHRRVGFVERRLDGLRRLSRDPKVFFSKTKVKALRPLRHLF